MVLPRSARARPSQVYRRPLASTVVQRTRAEPQLAEQEIGTPHVGMCAGEQMNLAPFSVLFLFFVPRGADRVRRCRRPALMDRHRGAVR